MASGEFRGRDRNLAGQARRLARMNHRAAFLQPDPSAETPHYHGHRERLRDRFRSAGADALSDYELFRELPLSFSICRIYARDHAHDEPIQKALQAVLGDAGDAKTNM